MSASTRPLCWSRWKAHVLSAGCHYRPVVQWTTSADQCNSVPAGQACLRCASLRCAALPEALLAMQAVSMHITRACWHGLVCNLLSLLGGPCCAALLCCTLPYFAVLYWNPTLASCAVLCCTLPCSASPSAGRKDAGIRRRWNEKQF